MDNLDIYYSTQAIEIKQPLGTFYIFKIPASKLVPVTFSMAAYSHNGKIKGIQRKLKDDRIKQIASFCNSTGAIFPNTIILSANFNPDGTFEVDDSIRWKVDDGNLIIPSNAALASIVDGQHRVEGIKKAIEDEDFKDFEFVCAVFIDLAFAQQAEIFTSINYNQKKVDKSVAYELFGYDLEDSDINSWSPDTLAIYFSRILNKDDSSPLQGHIFSSLKGEIKGDDWYVSTACIVESISLLLTNDATKDRYEIHKNVVFGPKGRKRLTQVKSSAPLRDLFIERRDKDIFEIILKFLKKADELNWFSGSDLVTTKTIGFLAMFEVLKEAIVQYGVQACLSTNEWLNFLESVELKNLHKKNFSFSGIGKGEVKKIISSGL